MKKPSLILLFVFAAALQMAAQEFFPEENWKKYRHHWEIGFGTTNFLGDLGGKDAIGTNDLKDLEWSEFHLCAFTGYRYSIAKHFLARVNFNYGRLSGDDKLTKEPFRHNRNINFQTDIFEISAMGEVRFRVGSKKGHQYKLDRVNTSGGPWHYRGSYFSLFAGIGVFKFNPKSYVNGQWIELYPLRTEGQGLPGGPEPYHLWNLSIPVGLNWMFKMHKQWSFGFDITYRYTFTDYIDDVSTDYYNPYDVALYNVDNGMADLAAYLSNPALGLANGGLSDLVTSPGSQRGDKKDNDGFFYLMIKTDFLFMKQNDFFKPKTRGHGKSRRFRSSRPMRF